METIIGKTSQENILISSQKKKSDVLALPVWGRVSSRNIRWALRRDWGEAPTDQHCPFFLNNIYIYNH